MANQPPMRIPRIPRQSLRHLPVNLYDISPEALTKASEAIAEELERRVEEQLISPEEKEAILNRILITRDVEEAASDVDLVIEAIPELLELKREVFGTLDEICDGRTILATNSSSIRVSKIEDATGRLDRVLNTHFYNIP